MHLKNNLLQKTLVILTVLVLIISPFFVVQASSVQLALTDEYALYVHTYLNAPQGNYTQLDKPIFPVFIANTTIQIGGNWTIICPLQAGHNYHVYCFGNWVNTSSVAKTDYDIYVYNPQGKLESSHTEAAGLPEHLGTTTNDAFFTPQQSGNYSFLVKNDERESQGSQAATFTIVENLETDRWVTSQVEGKINNATGVRTCWTYEFITNQSQVELYVNVPQTLDMYEARLYLMSNASSLKINDIPLPWEPGLNGNLTGAVGGYNFESQAYRGVAYASCEQMGQSMFLTYNSTIEGPKLYHLVLIGEEGSGSVDFMFKTKFGNASLSPLMALSKVMPDQPAEIAYKSNNASLKIAELFYTINNWTTSSTIKMAISNHTCNTTIPGQAAGSVVQYRVDANDTLNNAMSATGNYTVKYQPTLNITAAKDPIVLGENLTFTGTLTHPSNESTVTVHIYSANETLNQTCTVTGDGVFTCTFQPTTSGNWSAIANSLETKTSWSCSSSQFQVTVKEPPLYVKYSLYIVIGLVATSAAGGVVWFLKFRGR